MQYRTLTMLVMLFCMTPLLNAQGLIIDRRPEFVPIADYRIEALDVDVQIREQVADVRLTQTLHNPGHGTIEAEFFFPLPEDVQVRDFVLIVDGKEYPGEILNKDEARRIYEDIVRSRKDPALLEYIGRGLFKTSVFPIPAGARRTLTLSYTQVCPRYQQSVDFVFPLMRPGSTPKPIGQTSLQVDLKSSEAIKSIYSPSHDVGIERSGDDQATVRWSAQQRQHSQDFRLVYTLVEGEVGASLLSYWPDESQDGFYMLLASPEIEREDKAPLAKTVIFVLDKSGSMAGKKLQQSKQALQFVVDNLNEGDLFNIITYDDRMYAFKPELQAYGTEARNEATAFVSNIREGGSTNIDGALSMALDMVKNDDRPAYVIFLTDGLPTSGERNEAKIADNCSKRNAHSARMFVFGVGYDVNARLLDRLTSGNAGAATYVSPDQDIEKNVGEFYSKIESPAMTHLAFELPGAGLNRTYPRDLPDLFQGGQLVLVGRYTKGGAHKIKLSGKIDGTDKAFEFEAKLADKGERTRHDFIERVWANRRVGDLVDQIDLHGQSDELVNELIALSKEYGIMTPYTSFLADDQMALDGRAITQVTRERLQSLDALSGFSGNAQRAMNNEMQLSIAADGVGMSTEAKAELSKAAAPMLKGVSNRLLLEENEQAGQNVLQMGRKTYYMRKNQWVDAKLIDKDGIVVPTSNQLVLYSDAYFEFIEKLTPEQVREVNLDRPAIFVMNGENWQLIE